MARQTSVKDLVSTFEVPANSDLPLKAMSPNGYIAMRAEKKKKETIVPIAENNTDEIHTNSAVVLAQHALDTARAPVDTNNPPVKTPMEAMRDLPSCWRENGCKIGACMGGTLAVIGTIFAVLAYLNDICVFPKCDEKPDMIKPCWDNDVNYVSTRLGISYNLTDENLYKKDSARECEKSCANYAVQGCEYWTYNKVEQWCHLKFDKPDDPMIVDNYISGKVGCIVPDNFLQISKGYKKNSPVINS